MNQSEERGIYSHFSELMVDKKRLQGKQGKQGKGSTPKGKALRKKGRLYANREGSTPTWKALRQQGRLYANREGYYAKIGMSRDNVECLETYEKCLETKWNV